ncbi:MAG: tryptophan synthase subunit beta, partial [Pseudomonadota bacterium]|nr:tryptophan synthase subunit beta [Pseudomonadota bacterium]
MNKNSYKDGPDKEGNFGIFGGKYVAETLMPLITDLENEYEQAKKDKK